MPCLHSLSLPGCQHSQVVWKHPQYFPPEHRCSFGRAEGHGSVTTALYTEVSMPWNPYPLCSSIFPPPPTPGNPGWFSVLIVSLPWNIVGFFSEWLLSLGNGHVSVSHICVWLCDFPHYTTVLSGWATVYSLTAGQISCHQVWTVCRESRRSRPSALSSYVNL